jgi:RNA polymerase sigma-70 factor (ECF subfamily)
MNALTAAQETQLVRMAQQGDRQAFSELISAMEARIFRVALQICRNQEEAEDAMQDGLLKAYQKLATFNGASRFSTWATRIVINECLMRLRSAGQRFFTSIDEPKNDDGDLVLELCAWEENPEQRISRQQLRSLLDEALRGLDEDYRVVVLLRDVEGLTNEETAQELGISVAAVKSRLLRGRLALRQRLTRTFMRKSRASAPGAAFDMQHLFATLLPLAPAAAE